jgi:tetratricopeptide (TPR) repeat protein
VWSALAIDPASHSLNNAVRESTLIGRRTAEFGPRFGHSAFPATADTMRRLRIWYYETRETLRHWGYGIRAGMRECSEVARAPFRAIRSVFSGGMVREARVGSREFVGVIADFFRALGNFLWAIVSMIVWLPYHCYRLIVYGPRQAWIGVRSAPPRFVAIVAAVSLTVVGAVGATGGYLWWENRREFQRRHLYREQDYYMSRGDLDSLERTLEQLRARAPDDATIAARLEGVRARTAPINDPTLLRVVMRAHFFKEDYALAAREAAKLIETLPLDWEARCVLVDEASRRDDRSAIQNHLAALPRAGDMTEPIEPWVARYSAILFQRIGETERFDEMVDLIILNVLPLMRGKEIVLLENDAKLLLLDCYRLALTQLDKRQRLTQYWEPAQRVCQSMLDDESKGEARQFYALAMTLQMHLEVLKEFARRRHITETEQKSLAADVEQRLRAACERTIAVDPKWANAYVLLAEHFFRDGKVDRAFEAIENAFGACGETTELIAEKAQLLQRTDPQAALVYLDDQVHLDKANPMLCQVYAQVAYGAGRPDKALGACRQAQKLQAGVLWAHRFEAEICLRLGRTTEAAAALQPVKSQLATDPAGCALYVQVMSACGSYALAEEFLQQVAAENRPIEVLVNAATALLSQHRLDDAVRWAKIVLERETTNVHALLIVGDAMRALAEVDPRNWDRDKARESLRAYRAVQRQQPDNWVVVNNIVWLELKALELPQQAYESSEPLRSIQNRTTLPAEFMDTLAEVYIAVGRHEQARLLLDEALRTAGPRAAFYTHLALAHHGLNQPEMAEKYLLSAAQMPNKSSRESAELFDAIRTINHKK